MKKLLLILVISFLPALAWAQCNGLFPPSTVCGNSSLLSNAPPGPITIPSGTGGVNSAQINAGGGVSISGTCATTTALNCTVSSATSVTPQFFGALCDGVTDDTAALQTAVADPHELVIPAGSNCLTAAALTFTGTGKVIRGSGYQTSVITMTNGTANGIVLNSTGGLILSGFGITTSVTKTAGDTIQLNCTAACVSFKSHIQNLVISGTMANPLFNGINVVSGVIPAIRDNYILNASNSGIQLQASSSAFGGQAVIAGNTLNTAVGSGAAILYHGGAGQTIITNNRIENYNYGVLVSMLDPPGTTDSSLIITGNDFESQSVSAIALSAAGASTMQSATITGNRFIENTGGLCIQNATTANWLNVTSIVGNSFQYSTANCLQIAGGYSLHISSNVFSAFSNITAIQLNTSFPSGPVLLGPNQYTGATVGVSLSSPFSFNANPNVTFTRYPFETAAVSPVTGATINFPEYTNDYIIEPAGGLAALNVVFPANPTQGAIIRFSTTQSITALTTTPSAGQNIANGYGGSAFSSGSAAAWKWLSPFWFRVQ